MRKLLLILFGCLLIGCTENPVPGIPEDAQTIVENEQSSEDAIEVIKSSDKESEAKVDEIINVPETTFTNRLYSKTYHLSELFKSTESIVLYVDEELIEGDTVTLEEGKAKLKYHYKDKQNDKDEVERIVYVLDNRFDPNKDKSRHLSVFFPRYLKQGNYNFHNYVRTDLSYEIKLNGSLVNDHIVDLAIGDHDIEVISFYEDGRVSENRQSIVTVFEEGDSDYVYVKWYPTSENEPFPVKVDKLSNPKAIYVHHAENEAIRWYEHDYYYSTNYSNRVFLPYQIGDNYEGTNIYSSFELGSYSTPYINDDQYHFVRASYDVDLKKFDFLKDLGYLLYVQEGQAGEESQTIFADTHNNLIYKFDHGVLWMLRDRNNCFLDETFIDDERFIYVYQLTKEGMIKEDISYLFEDYDYSFTYGEGKVNITRYEDEIHHYYHDKSIRYIDSFTLDLKTLIIDNYRSEQNHIDTRIFEKVDQVIDVYSEPSSQPVKVKVVNYQDVKESFFTGYYSVENDELMVWFKLIMNNGDQFFTYRQKEQDEYDYYADMKLLHDDGILDLRDSDGMNYNRISGAMLDESFYLHESLDTYEEYEAISIINGSKGEHVVGGQNSLMCLKDDRFVLNKLIYDSMSPIMTIKHKTMKPTKLLSNYTSYVLMFEDGEDFELVEVKQEDEEWICNSANVLTETFALKARVNVNILNKRAKYTVKSDVLGKAKKDEVYEIKDIVYSDMYWYQIEDGSWVAAKYCRLVKE